MEPALAHEYGEPELRRSSTLTLIGVGIVVVAVVGVLYWYFALRMNVSSEQQTDPSVGIISQAVRGGAYTDAVDHYQEAVASGNLNASNHALATVNAFAAFYKADGSLDDVIAGIRELKAAFAVPGVSDFAKAQIITTLATAYNETGENPAILDEVYKDEPFKSHYDANSRSRTQGNMMKWAYDLSPNSRAAISIANTYVSYALGRPYVPGRAQKPDTTNELIVQAKEYLKKSDELLKTEMAQNPSYAEKTRYATQQYWRAFTIGSMTYLGDTEFRSSYQDEYASFISRFGQSENNEAKQYIPFAYLNSAIGYSAVDKNEKKAQEQILKLIAYVNADPLKDVSEFVTLMKSEKERVARDGANYTSTWVEHFTKTMPEFKKFIEDIQTARS